MNTQPFSVIRPIENAAALGGTQRAANGSAGTDGMFADIFKSAIDNVKTTDQEKNEAQYLLATGQMDNPAEATIATTKAAAAVELLVQLRNKALDAYSELTRINL